MAGTEENVKSSDLLREKHFWRLHFRERARALARGPRRRGAEAAARRAAALAAFRRAKTVGIFLSLPFEIDTRPLLRLCRAAGKDIAVPVVFPETKTLRFARWPGAGALKKNVHGVGEPRRPEWVATPDLVFVPGAAFTGRGERLGAGGGYYDRFLSRARRALSVGLCFDEQLAARLPHGAHDRSVSWVVTPKKVFVRTARK